MQKMGMLRNVLKSGYFTRVGLQNQGVSSFLRDSPRAFSAAAEGATQASSILEPFYKPSPTTGVKYARLENITSHTTKSDVLNLLDGCNLTLEDLKVDYGFNFSVIGMLVRFPSEADHNAAVRAINRKGRLYRLNGSNAERWNYVYPYNGKAVLLQGIPLNALQDDIERFLSGCPYDESAMKIIIRRDANPEKMAVVGFPSTNLAVHAYITKNRGFCLNNQISAIVTELRQSQTISPKEITAAIKASGR